LSCAPVVLFVFARPDTTEQLVEIVKRAEPSKVLVVGDGPRDGSPDDAARCEAVRELIAAAAWDCELLTAYAERNLGLKRRIETGLDWAFGLVDEAIVLEDDCMPHPSFFDFCSELLERYRDEPRVMSVSGNNFGHGADVDASYFFSRYPLIWGWATWARAWKLDEPELVDWPALMRSGWLDELFPGDDRAVQYWTYIFDNVYRKRHTWDFGWTLASWRAGGLTATPRVNLVTNVGFREDATNTHPDIGTQFSNVPAVAIDMPLRHPAWIERNAEADAALEDVMYSGNLRRLLDRLRTRRRAAVATG
jgi:hypothetical protein